MCVCMCVNVCKCLPSSFPICGCVYVRESHPPSFPTLGNQYVPPTSGKSPMPVSGMANTHFSVAMRKGDPIERPTPPPITKPSQREIWRRLCVCVCISGKGVCVCVDILMIKTPTPKSLSTNRDTHTHSLSLREDLIVQRVFFPEKVCGRMPGLATCMCVCVCVCEDILPDAHYVPSSTKGLATRTTEEKEFCGGCVCVCVCAVEGGEVADHV